MSQRRHCGLLKRLDVVQGELYLIGMGERDNLTMEEFGEFVETFTEIRTALSGLPVPDVAGESQQPEGPSREAVRELCERAHWLREMAFDALEPLRSIDGVIGRNVADQLEVAMEDCEAALACCHSESKEPER